VRILSQIKILALQQRLCKIEVCVQLTLFQLRIMRSFSLVDHKVAEADFFLKKLSECHSDFFAARCYVGAFISSARSITYALQSVLGDLDAFSDWYGERQEMLTNDDICKFLRKFRNLNQHIGENLVSGGSYKHGNKAEYWFMPTNEIREVPSIDVESACEKYITAIISIIFDCYTRFGPQLDAQQYYTAEYFQAIGKSIEDAEEELGFPRGWTDIGDPDATPYCWQALRDTVAGCEINHLFQEYIGKIVPAPKRLKEYQNHD